MTEGYSNKDALGTLMWATGILDTYQQFDQAFPSDDPVTAFPFMSRGATLIDHIGLYSSTHLAQVRDLTVLYFGQVIRAQVYQSRVINLNTYFEYTHHNIDRIAGLDGKVALVDGDLSFKNKAMHRSKNCDLRLANSMLKGRLICLSLLLGQYPNWDNPLVGPGCDNIPDWLSPVFD